MIALTLAEIAEIVGGELWSADPGTLVTGPVVADSRTASPGGLFVADGPGHQFAADAVARGAVAVLSSRPLPAGVPCVLAPPAPDYTLDASVVAIGRLARAVGGRLTSCTVVALTGSAGKTSTKDLLAHVLSAAGPTVAPKESLNDELGMPLTALRAEVGTRYLVLEMGARGIGHLTYLTGLVRPRIGIVLNVGLAHVGEFGDREQIAQAKGELVEALPAAADGGVAVLNADDSYVRAMASRTSARVVLVGEADDADVRAVNVQLDAGGHAAFGLSTPDGEAEVRLGLVGRHHVGNALAVAAVGLEAGLKPTEVAAALSSAKRESRWRMQVSDRPDGVTIVNDAYNANPDSVRAALETLPVLAGSGDGSEKGNRRRTWAVLGEMLELGAVSRTEHEKLGELAVRQGVDRLVAVGEGARPILDGASRQHTASGEEPVPVSTAFVPDAGAALELLREQLRPGDIVLVKSSRDAGLRYLGDKLVADVADVTDGGVE
jgi:UDP-N-acetylmuramoyl-tripeptide--D-alanyl-D-alanine ligase